MFRISVELDVSYSVRCLLIVPLQKKQTKAIKTSESIADSAKFVVAVNMSLFYTYLCFSYEQSAQKLIFASTHWQLMALYAQMYALFIS